MAPAFVARHARLVRAACARYHVVVCVSPAVLAALHSARVAPDRLACAPAFLLDALDERLVPAGLPALRRRHPTLVCAAAAPGPEYGLRTLAAAFDRLRADHPQAALVLFGDAGGRSPRAPGIYQLGELPRGEALGLIASSDVFVRPTTADGDSISVREALALGRRVVASDAVERPRGVFIHRTGDAADLARRLAEALAAPPPPVVNDGASATLFTLYRRLGLRASLEPLPEVACAASSAA
jgi:glycosyltransferase involved in cell wall biosynthesis